MLSSNLVAQLKLLLRLWTQPAAAMGDILDRGSLLFSSLLALAMTFALLSGPVPFFFSFYTPFLVLAGVFVPGVILISVLIARLGAIGTVFQRDFSSLLTCAAMAWSAALLPAMLAIWTAPLNVLAILGALEFLYFLVLMFFAVRTVFGIETRLAAGIISLSWVPLVAAAFLAGPLTMILRLIASPFFLFFAFYYLRNEFSNLGQGLRNRQNFHRMLEAAAVNPHDGEAQYQLGLIHQQRRQYTEAIRRFQQAIAIDPSETDAHFQLGRIAYQQGRFADALASFQTVLWQDEKHSLNEIHRELGASYLALGRPEDARHELAIYTDRRAYDPEGLYHYGQTLEALGDPANAKEMYARAIEAARTAPRYRRPFTARWSRLAQKQSRKLS